MRIIRSPGEEHLIYVLVTDKEAADLRADLRKAKSPLVKALRAELKKVLH